MTPERAGHTESEAIELEPAENNVDLLTAEPHADSDTTEEFDPSDIVEAAEQMLRESAPHDFQVLVIGGGIGGYEAALRAAELGARVGLIEAHQLGGSYLEEFIPTRNYLEAIRYNQNSNQVLDGTALRAITDALAGKLRAEMRETLLTSGVTLITGIAKFVEEHCIEVRTESETRRVKAVHLIIAVGARAVRRQFTGDTLPWVLEPRELLRQTTVPERLVVIGADAVGVELAYLCQRLGSRVTLLEAGLEILPEADSDVRRKTAQVLHDCGVAIKTFSRAQQAQPKAAGIALGYLSGDEEVEVEVDAVLLAADYSVDAQAMELQTIGVDIKDGKILVDEDFQTNINGLYAIGGCVHGLTGPQVARSEGRRVAEHALGYPAHLHSLHTPWCCQIHPAAAAVGITEDVANWAGVLCLVGKRPLQHFRLPSEKDAVDGEYGFVKVVIDAESRRLLGCHVVGDGANEMINVVTAAMDAGHTADEIAATCFTECSLGPELRAAIRAAR